MNHPQPHHPHGAETVSELIFEHPLTERVRNFLRLEAVLAEARERIPHPEPEISRAALTTLIELATLTERSDLKREVLTELERQRLILAQLRNANGVDVKRLRAALASLEHAQTSVEAVAERLGQNLKANEFLTSVRSRSAIPGGTCAFDLPALHCWLARPTTERQADLEHWLVEMRPLEEAVRVLLQHTRDAGEPAPAKAAEGVYGYTPPLENPPVLLRIALPTASGFFPVISAGRHRITIQFQRWLGADARPETLRCDVEFTLTLCKL